MRRFPRVFVLLLLTVFAAVLFAKTCTSCGTENSDAAKFCKSCGAKLPEAVQQRPQSPRVQGYASVSGASVSITSDPSGAGVTVDGRSRGTTPLELNDLRPGRHEYELTRSGYRTFYGAFTTAGLYSTLVVTSDPVGAEILLDNVPRGTAGEAGLVLSQVPYGNRTVTARIEGYRDVVKPLDVRTPGPIAVPFKLGSGKGYLRVESDPPGAKLFVDSRQAGETPYGAELAPARYVLSLTRRGFYDWFGYAEVQYAETANIRAVLDRMPSRQWPFLAAAAAAVGYGGFAAIQGEATYGKYTAENQPPALRDATKKWDLQRNIAAGVTAVFAGLYLLVRW